MNRFIELHQAPFYSYKIQKQATLFPPNSQARNDKHSNYQSILSDLSSSILGLEAEAAYNYMTQYINLCPTDATSKIYCYSANNAPRINFESILEYESPISVKTNTDLTGYNEKLYGNLVYEKTELDGRLPLCLKSIGETNSATAVLDVIDNKILVWVKERAYVGMKLIPNEGYNPERQDFYYRTENVVKDAFYFFGVATIRNSAGETIDRSLITYEQIIRFNSELPAGLYEFAFEFIDPEQLSNFSVEIIENFNFGKYEKRFVSGSVEFPGENRGTLIVGAWSVGSVESDPDNDYLMLTVPDDILENASRNVETYTLIDENNDQIKISDWMFSNGIIYVLEHFEDPEQNSKLHLFNSNIDGNQFVYEDNDKYFIDLVCDEYDYVPGDPITIETRITSLPADFKDKNIRLKIENAEDIDPTVGKFEPYYISQSGEAIRGDKAWVSLGSQMIRWDFVLDNIGSYRISVEAINKETKEVFTAGAKLITLKYKFPWKTFNLGENFSGYNLAINPDNVLELHGEDARHAIEFHKDGYFFDATSGRIWTNTSTTQLVVEYDGLEEPIIFSPNGYEDFVSEIDLHAAKAGTYRIKDESLGSLKNRTLNVYEHPNTDTNFGYGAACSRALGRGPEMVGLMASGEDIRFLNDGITISVYENNPIDKELTEVMDVDLLGDIPFSVFKQDFEDISVDNLIIFKNLEIENQMLSKNIMFLKFDSNMSKMITETIYPGVNVLRLPQTLIHKISIETISSDSDYIINNVESPSDIKKKGDWFFDDTSSTLITYSDVSKISIDIKYRYTYKYIPIYYMPVSVMNIGNIANIKNNTYIKNIDNFYVEMPEVQKEILWDSIVKNKSAWKGNQNSPVALSGKYYAN
jgi:hypothetical protein